MSTNDLDGGVNDLDTRSKHALKADGPDPLATAAPPSSHVVIGLDLSLRSTGIAGAHWAETLHGPKLADDATDAERWRRIRRMRWLVVEHLGEPDLVVLEGPSYGSNDPSADERDALWWLVRGALVTREIPVAKVAPATLKVYATGNGRAKKADVLADVRGRRPDVPLANDNEADALVLAAMGLDHLGQAPVELPQTHRRALDGVRWPALAGAA